MTGNGAEGKDITFCYAAERAALVKALTDVIKQRWKKRDLSTKGGDGNAESRGATSSANEKRQGRLGSEDAMSEKMWRC